MNTLFLLRMDKTSKQILGTLILDENFTFCRTLELPWIYNKPNISCIPEGSYLCKYTYSPRFLKRTYEVLNVPNRSGIRIHSANFSRDLKGCIALGDDVSDIDRDGLRDVTNSKKTIARFEKMLEHKPFLLVIH